MQFPISSFAKNGNNLKTGAPRKREEGDGLGFLRSDSRERGKKGGGVSSISHRGSPMLSPVRPESATLKGSSLESSRLGTAPGAAILDTSGGGSCSHDPDPRSAIQ